MVFALKNLEASLLYIVSSSVFHVVQRSVKCIENLLFSFPTLRQFECFSSSATQWKMYGELLFPDFRHSDFRHYDIRHYDITQ